MSIVNGIIVAPVSINDVRTVLGMASTDLATLCISSAINKWARYKPQGQPSVPYPLTDAMRRSENWGLKVASTFRQLSRVVSGFSTNYEYVRPEPGKTFCRLTDFVKYDSVNGGSTTTGYNPDAKPFVSASSVATNAASGKDTYYKNYNNAGAAASVTWYRTTRADEISLSDLDIGLTSADDAYFGVIVFDNSASSSQYRLICASSKVGTAARSGVTIPDSVLTIGHNYTVYPVISLGNENATGEGLVTDLVAWNVISLPADPVSFSVADASSLVSIDITSLTSTVLLSRPTVSVTFSGRANGDISVPVSELRIRVYGGATEATANTLIDACTTYLSRTYTRTAATDTLTWNRTALGQVYSAIKVVIDSPALNRTFATATATTTSSDEI